MEHALVIIKPDGVQRKLMGPIISRLEEKGFLIIGLKMTFVSEELAGKLYSVHKGKDFYDQLIRYMTSSPVVGIVLKGINAVNVTRKLIGATFGQDAEPGTIRGDYAISKRFNLIHCSDSQESADKEVRLFFKNEELLDYDTTDLPWIYDTSKAKYV